MQQPHLLFRVSAVVSSGLLVTGLVFFRAGVLHKFLPTQVRAATSTDEPTVEGNAFFDLRLLADLDESFASQQPFVVPSELSLNTIRGAESGSNGFAFDLLPDTPAIQITTNPKPTMMAGSKSGVGLIVWTPENTGVHTMMAGSKSIVGIVAMSQPDVPPNPPVRVPPFKVKDRSSDMLRPLTMPSSEVMSGSKSAVGVIPDSWFLSNSYPDFFESVVPVESEQSFTLPTITPAPRR